MKTEKNRVNFFLVCPLLITVDGPDGSGKSTFSEVFTSEIKKRLGANRVVLIRPTRFDCSPEAKKIGERLNRIEKRIKLDDKIHNSFFLDALQINYEKVVLPAVGSGKIVVIDSSEIRALAFIIEKGSEEAKKDTRIKIKNGAIICWSKPRIRIILNSSPEELFKNLATKKVLDRGDPRNIDEIKARTKTYEDAIRIIRDVEGDEGTEWIFIQIQHIQGNPLSYLSGVIKKNNLLQRILS